MLNEVPVNEGYLIVIRHYSYKDIEEIRNKVDLL